MKEKVTINDIAKMCNVSKSSVSRYLNHGYVSKENAQKIQAAIEETGFQSNYFASRIKRRRSHIVGIIVPSLAGYGIGKMLDGILQALTKMGYQGVILQSGGKCKMEAQCVSLLEQQGVDGIIFLDSLFAENYRDMFTKGDIRALFVNQTCSYAPAISMYEKEAVQTMLDHVRERGHRRILYMKGHHHRSALRQDAMQAQWGTQDIHVLPVALHENGVYDQAKEVLRYQADVLICDSDEIALCCMKYFSQMHIRVPQDISVLTFSETPLYEAANPSLTHIAYDYEGFGRYAAENMIAVIAEKPMIEKREFFVFEERDSVADRNIHKNS